MLQPESSKPKPARPFLTKVDEVTALSRQRISDLEIIKENISERIKVADTSEIPGLLALLQNVQGQIEKETQAEETRKEMILARRFKAIDVARKLFGVSAAIGIGLYLTLLNSLVGPFILIIGLAICMDVPLGELSNLVKAFVQFTGGAEDSSPAKDEDRDK